MSSIKAISSALGMSCLISMANAATLIYESFNDPDPSLNGNASGIGIDTTWSGGWKVSSGSYSYGALSTSGNKAFADSRTASSAGIIKGTGNPLFDAGLLNDGATLWFSAVVLSNPTPGNGNMDYGFAFGSNAISGSNAVPISDAGDGGQAVGFSLKSGQIRASMWDAIDGTGVERGSGVAFAGATNYLVVGKITWGSGGGNDTVELYTPTTDLTQGSVVSTYSAKNLSQANFDTISFGNKADDLPIGIDEIRFGSSYDDVVVVVPEPATGLLTLVGTLALLLRRRR